MTTFSKIAPRLHKAHSERKVELRALELQWMKLEDDRVRLEGLVAHRDLQLIRAYQRNSGRYIETRRQKLNEAQGALDRCMDRRVKVREEMG